MASSTRDTRIDFIRGCAILTITVTHLNWLCQAQGYLSPFKLYTYQSLGFSSSAEIFVFLSGYVSSLVYGRTLAELGLLATQARALHRAWQLYCQNILTLFLVLAIASTLFDPVLMHESGFDRFAAGGLDSVRRFALFDLSPAIFEVLQLYIVLLVPAPLVLAATRRAPLAVLGASVGLYLAAQLWPQINLVRGGEPWNFNPFAWQLLFFGGAVVAVRLPAMERWRFGHRSAQLTVACSLLLAGFVLKFGVLKAPGPAALLVRLVDKATVAPLRLAHFAVVMWLLLMIVPDGEFIRRHRSLAAVADLGRNSLECFCISIGAAYGAAALWGRSGRDVAAYWLCAGLALGMLMLGSRLVLWLKGVPWQAPRRR